MTVAEHADRSGDFTEIVYFTSEQDAQRFEPAPPAEADEPVQEERRRLMTELRCFDLRDPQLLSRPRSTPTSGAVRAAPVMPRPTGPPITGSTQKFRGHDDRTSAAGEFTSTVQRLGP
jgi:hypothetical protein